jgi:pyruvate formate lyase activating enzyme
MRGSVIGRIFDIQRFSLHDGPGIRVVVFLKGCALRCRWCCNPESQERGIQVSADGKKTFGEDAAASAVMEEVLRDMPYFRRSGGGLTLSGGECLLQPDFSQELLILAKEAGITTAVESTAFGPYETIRDKIMPHLDLFLMDIKHMDEAKHKEFTGHSNAPMLESAKQMARAGQDLIIRVPVIPGFNDTVEEVKAIAAFAASLPGVEKIHLLPYHSYGAAKYAQLGRKHLMGDAAPPSGALMEELRLQAEKAGLDAQIGG